MKRPPLRVYAIVLEERFLHPQRLEKMRRYVGAYRKKDEAEAESKRLMGIRVTGREWKMYSVEEVVLK